MKAALIEALKEALRVVMISIIPILIDGLTRGIVDSRLVAITAAITFLRAVDKWLHEWGKESEGRLATLAEGGLTRF